MKDYKPPKDDDRYDDITRKLKEEGCGPKLQIPETHIKREDAFRVPSSSSTSNRRRSRSPMDSKRVKKEPSDDDNNNDDKVNDRQLLITFDNYEERS